jgi:hypothetical protein
MSEVISSRKKVTQAELAARREGHPAVESARRFAAAAKFIC